MPLIKSKSKRAFERNVKAEMDAGKPQPQALAIAYSMKRKKMAEGGRVKRNAKLHSGHGDREHGVHQDLTYDKGISQMGNQIRSGVTDSAKISSKVNLEELRAMPKPKLAEGGEIKQMPRTVESSIIKPKRLDQYGNPIDEMQDHKSQMLKPSQKDMEHDEHEAEEIPAMAEGGEVSDEDVMEHKRQMLEQSRPMIEQDQHEDEELPEHHDSVADAIMAKRRKMANGGQVDIEENNEEQPNSFYEQNEHEALDWDMDDDQLSDQPMDSNEDDREIDSDEHDMISAIRRKMRVKMAEGGEVPSQRKQTENWTKKQHLDAAQEHLDQADFDNPDRDHHIGMYHAHKAAANVKSDLPETIKSTFDIAQGKHLAERKKLASLAKKAR